MEDRRRIHDLDAESGTIAHGYGHGRQEVRRWVLPPTSSCTVLLLLGAMMFPINPALSREVASDAGPPFHALLELETSAHLLAVLLDCGRAVINEHQDIADGPAAHSTPMTAATFERLLIEEFRSRTGLDLRALHESRVPDKAKRWLPVMLAASKQVMADYESGLKAARGDHPALIPAVFGSRVAARFTDLTGVRLKQTSLMPRNPSNAPDSFERAMLMAFADPSHPREQPISEVTTQSRSLRLMYPLYTTRQCLTCHGEPRGELDRTGHPREGLQLGQNAGAISIVIPLSK